MMNNNTINRGAIAQEYFYKGYNCAQSIALAFKDLVNIDETTLIKMVSSLGGGVGRLREMCGAFNASMIILGLIEGYDNPDDINVKNKLYANVQKLGLEFEKLNGSLVCRELLHLEEKHSDYHSTIRDENFYKTRPCANYIYSAAHILQKYLEDKDNKLLCMPQADKDMLQLDKYEEEMLS